MINKKIERTLEKWNFDKKKIIMKLSRLIKLIILFSYAVNYAQSNNENYYNNLFFTLVKYGVI